MNILALLLLPSMLAASAAKPSSQEKAPPQAPAQTGLSEHQKTLYAIGLALGQSSADLNLKPDELPFVVQGLEDFVNRKKPQVSLPEYGPKIDALAKERREGPNKAFLQKAAAEPGAKKTESGLIIQVLQRGDGPSPKASDKVKVHYKGTLINGQEFDSSYRNGQPVEFPLNRVIACWTEGVQLMKVGEKAKLVCPSDIAYGQRGSPPVIPPGAVLVFEIELLGISQ